MTNLPLYTELRGDRRLLVEQLPLAAPHAVFVEVSSRCNFKCRFCPQSMAEFSGGHLMSTSLYDRILGSLRDLGRIKVLRMYGTGESTLHKDLSQMVWGAYKARVADRIELTTNGTGPLLPLLGRGLDYLRVSVYGATSETMREFTSSTIPPEKVLANVTAFLRARGNGPPVVCAKMTDPSEGEERLFRRTWEGVADEVAVERTHAWSGSQALASSTFTPLRFEVCPSPFHTLFIHVDGDVGACCVDWAKHTVVGNVASESLESIWHGERLQAFRRMHLERRRGENAACRDCCFPDTMHPADNLDSWSGP